jgi:hypothetical protein
MQGAHMFGKIALSEPVNYACDDLAPRAHAPNVGYLAQAFEVEDLEEACEAARETGAPTVLAPARDELPLLGRRAHALLRNPGSGALQWLMERA